jgi:hypothetical protein
MICKWQIMPVRAVAVEYGAHPAHLLSEITFVFSEIDP